jgi:hypothetical protein
LLLPTLRIENRGQQTLTLSATARPTGRPVVVDQAVG